MRMVVNLTSARYIMHVDSNQLITAVDYSCCIANLSPTVKTEFLEFSCTRAWCL